MKHRYRFKLCRVATYNEYVTVTAATLVEAVRTAHIERALLVKKTAWKPLTKELIT